LFAVHKLDDFVPTPQLLRSIRVMANEALAKMDRIFARKYEADVKGGRPNIALEKLRRAILLQVLYSIRPERQFMEHALLARPHATPTHLAPEDLLRASKLRHGAGVRTATRATVYSQSHSRQGVRA
jgi:hypothetical protein